MWLWSLELEEVRGGWGFSGELRQSVFLWRANYPHVMLVAEVSHFVHPQYVHIFRLCLRSLPLHSQSLPHTGLGKEYALLLASRGAKVVGKGVGGALKEGCMSGRGTYI